MAQYVITNQGRDIPFEDCENETQRVVQNAKNLLMLQLGELPFDRLRGFDMGLYNLPLDQFQAELPPADAMGAESYRYQRDSGRYQGKEQYPGQGHPHHGRD